jgi:hypothetical protein
MTIGAARFLCLLGFGVLLALLTEGTMSFLLLPSALRPHPSTAIADWHYWVNRGYSFDDFYSDEEY